MEGPGELIENPSAPFFGTLKPRRTPAKPPVGSSRAARPPRPACRASALIRDAGAAQNGSAQPLP